MARTLTTAAIKAIRPIAKRQEVRDAGAVGLYLLVQPGGAKSWALRFRRPGGKPGKLTLGPYDPSGEYVGEPVIGAPLTLAAARTLAASVARERARGRDVVADRKAAKVRLRVQQQECSTNTFGQAVRDYVERHAMPKTRGGRRTARVLGLAPDGSAIQNSLAARWGERPVAEIDSHTIYDAVEEARQRGVPGLTSKIDRPSDARARQLLACLSSLFAWLHRHRRVEANPVRGVHGPAAPSARDRVLNDAELVAFWAAASAEPLGPALKLLLLTGCRLNEVGGLRCSELSADGTTWTIPGARTKNRRPHVVPLAPLARELIASVPDTGADLLFTATGNTPPSGWSKIKRRLDKAMADVPPWRLHDLRRTAATHMAEIGIAPHIVEAVLNHVSGARAGVAGTYNRAAYAPEKKAALERWAAHVEALVAGRSATVVPLRRHP